LVEQRQGCDWAIGCGSLGKKLIFFKVSILSGNIYAMISFFKLLLEQKQQGLTSGGKYSKLNILLNVPPCITGSYNFIAID
jgi:hypothetical protein